MLNVEHISFSYRKKEVLRDISFTAKEGDFIGIIGKNGCGKSTLLSVLSGVRQPACGIVSYNGVPLFSSKKSICEQSGSVSSDTAVSAWTPADIIGYVPQLNPLLPELSVRDRAMWGLFCTWGGEFVITDGIRKTYSEQYTDKEMLTKVYNSEYVVTRDELPDLKNYPIREDAN